MNGNPISVAFVCVQNAGRSQMAAGFAHRERHERGLDHAIEVHCGGTDPAEQVHGVVVDAMAAVDIDLSGEDPRHISREELLAMDIVITMGCSVEDVCPATWRGDARDWQLDDPAGKPIEEVRSIRNEIERRTRALFDELEVEVRPND